MGAMHGWTAKQASMKSRPLRVSHMEKDSRTRCQWEAQQGISATILLCYLARIRSGRIVAESLLQPGNGTGW